MSSPSITVVDLAGLGEAGAGALRASPFGPFDVRVGAPGAEDLFQWIATGCDVVLLDVDRTQHDPSRIDDATRSIAILVVTSDRSPEAALGWLRAGAQEVLLPAELLNDGALARRVQAAVERKRIERDARTAYATDLETGLPHQQQLMEHMSQLLALREREPSPMAVLALRVEGLATVQARLGRESANVLRRKVAVRLRAGVRASDVVASLGDDGFAVLLGAMLAPADAARVGAKLLASLLEPFKVTGSDIALAASLGVAQYPEDGTEPDVLLRRAVGLAASTPAQGRLGHANFEETAGRPVPAANDG